MGQIGNGLTIHPMTNQPKWNKLRPVGGLRLKTSEVENLENLHTMKTTPDQPITPCAFSVRIDFADADDLRYFTGYAAKAQMQDGTVSGLYAGLMCSALKRAKIKPLPESTETNG